MYHTLSFHLCFSIIHLTVSQLTTTRLLHPTHFVERYLNVSQVQINSLGVASTVMKATLHHLEFSYHLLCLGPSSILLTTPPPFFFGGTLSPRHPTVSAVGNVFCCQPAASLKLPLVVRKTPAISMKIIPEWSPKPHNTSPEVDKVGR